ncbi:MAG TPA: MMPL family transporter [Thermoleophilaceae bacterium]
MLAATAAVAALAGVLSVGVEKHLDPVSVDPPYSESFETREKLEAATGVNARPGVVALMRLPADRARAQARVRRVARIMEADPAVGRVTSLLRGDRRTYVSRDRKLTYVVAQLRPAPDRARQDAARRLAARLDARVPGVKLGGVDLALDQINKTIREDLTRAELFALPILCLLSFWFFRGVIAALLPIAIGGLAIVLTLLFLRVASEFISVSVVALNLVTALGLGLALDYSLLMVSRFREELAAAGGATAPALRKALATAGRAVAFSAVTVAASLAALLVLPERYFYSMGLAGAGVALLAALTALVVLPALLALLGPRVNSLAPARLQRTAAAAARPASSGAWYGLVRLLMRRPLPVALAASALLIALSLPALRMEGLPTDAAVLPETASARQVHDTIRTRFAVDPSRTIAVAVEDASRAERARLAHTIAGLPGVASVGRARPLRRDLAAIDVMPATPTESEAAQDLVRTIRELPAGFPVGVTGETALFVDLKTDLGNRLPLAVILMAAAAAFAVFLLTRSVVLPLMTLFANALTVCVAVGALVLIFQDGRFENLLGYDSPGALDLSQPVMVLAVAVGLSTDYGVFLLARVREAYIEGLSTRAAIAEGLERTGRVITAVALLFCVAVGALVSSRIISVKEVMLGTVIAVLIDATIVRALLVPAIMRICGRVNWWSPGAGMFRLRPRRAGEDVPRRP